ncbi:nuclear transport factor 2 family protein [Actinophytocola sp.]|uniref:nuclear transport factor 2 family protein n=1 Tax=Actinophytocola sp. TaxID=1872138 RepID=UPI003899B22F
MSDEIESLMKANLHEVFGERDPLRRAAAVERTYTDDVVFADPEKIVVGREALNAKAQRLLDEAPDFVFAEGGPIFVNHDLGFLAWTFGPEGQAPVVRGMDICLVESGLIAKVYTIITP